MFCCRKMCDLFSGPSGVPVRRTLEVDRIQLDTTKMGNEVVLIKGGTRACGSGGALATAPLVQSKSYFEVKLQQSGHWGIGVATTKTDLNQPRGGMDKESWCLTSDNCVRNDGKVAHELKGAEQTQEDRRDSLTDVLLPEIQTSGDVRLATLGIPSEGDTIGVSYDHVELNFYLNGKNLEVPVLNVRGSVYPALFGRLQGGGRNGESDCDSRSLSFQWTTERFWTLSWTTLNSVPRQDTIG